MLIPVVPGFPGFILVSDVGDRVVIPDAAGGKPFFQGGGVNQRLDGRAGLSLGKKGAVIGIQPEIGPPRHRQNIPGLRIQGQQCTLELGGNPSDALAQDPLGEPLQVQIHGRGDLQPPLFDDFSSIPFDQFPADMGQVIRGFPGLHDGYGLDPNLFCPAGGDHLELYHAFEDEVLPIAGDCGFPQGVVAGRGFGNPRQEGAFGLGQFLRILVEIKAGGLDDAPDPVPEMDFVEIHLQNLLLGVFAFVFHGQEAFLDLPLDGFFAGKIFILDQLLGDRRAPLGHSSL